MKYLATLIIAGAVFFGGIFLDSSMNKPTQPIVAGSFSPTGGGTYRLGSSIGTSNTTVKLSSFKEPVSNIPYTMTYLNSDIGYGTIDPQTSRSEFVSFSGVTQNSDGTALLTGVIRGLTRTPAGNFCTASTTLAQSHPGQSIFILSDSPCLFAEYAPLRTTATSTGTLIFSNTAAPRYNAVGVQGNGTALSTTSEFASVAYVNAVSFAGTSNATESAKGISELATQLEMASSSVTGSSGAGLVLQSKYSTTTPWNRNNYVVITRSDSTIDPLMISTTSAYTWANLNTIGSTTIPANSTAKLTLGGFPLAFPGSLGASSSVMASNGAGLMSWLPIIHPIAMASPNTSITAVGSTTLATVVIPAGTLTTSNQLRINAIYGSGIPSGNCYGDVAIGNGTTATTTLSLAGPFAIPNTSITTGIIVATSTSNGVSVMRSVNNSSVFAAAETGNTSQQQFISLNFAATTYIAFRVNITNVGGGTHCDLVSYDVDIAQ